MMKQQKTEFFGLTETKSFCTSEIPKISVVSKKQGGFFED